MAKYLKRKKRNAKSLVVLVSLVTLLVFAVSGTIAYLSVGTNEVKNVFIPTKVTTQVNEFFDGSTKSNVTIQNTGNTEAYIRAAIVVTWQDANGKVYGQKPVEGTDYDMTIGSGWTPDSNGFYVWNAVVARGLETGDLIDRCTSKGTAPEGFSLCVEILGSGIQAYPSDAVQDAWGYVPGVSG